MIVYGIKNCNTVKSALEWLKKNKVDVEFYDYKTKGISEAKLKDWSKQVGWEALVNKKGTTWRQLDDATKGKISSQKEAIALMISKTTVIKRPLLEMDGKVIALGFDEEIYSTKFF
ncbi:MAG: ArsC family reductase [Cyclobacteriaceae bacterium]|nr:ArsC family reductase [Cyclobacteriaceae bacterium]